MPDIDPNEEGRATPPPPLPPEAQRLGIKRDAVGTMQLPKEHWSAGMQPGEVKVQDGVVLGHVPKRQARVFVAGLRDGEQPAFEIAAIEDGLPDAPKRSSDQHLKFASWLAGYFGKDLTPAKKQSLETLYKQAAVDAQGIAAKTDSYKSPAEVEAARSAMTKVWSETVVAEQAIFKKSASTAQERRFGRTLSAGTMVPQATVLGKQLSRIIGGDYLKDDIARVRGQIGASSPTIVPVVARVTAEGLDRRLWHIEYEWLGNAVTVGYEGRGFVAEHPAMHLDWESYGLDGFYHTSIVAGIWVIRKQQRRATHFDDAGIADRTWTETVTRSDFAAWCMACGAASTYEPADRLRLIFKWTAASWEAADRLVRTLTPTDANKYYRIRSAAYSEGNYGLHWVCHQTANAFAVRKWGVFPPVTYPISCILYGPYGLQGVATHLDWAGGVRLGCVPGVMCYYNITPPYSVPDPVFVAAEERNMSGAGWGLERHFNPKLGKWVDSGVSFAATPVPFSGPSELVSVQNT